MAEGFQIGYTSVCGFVYRKCGYVPGKADPQQQQAWLEESFAPEPEVARQGQQVLLFMDAANVARPTLYYHTSAV